MFQVLCDVFSRIHKNLETVVIVKPRDMPKALEMRTKGNNLSRYPKQIDQDMHANSSRYPEQTYAQPEELGNHRQTSAEKAPGSPLREEQRLSVGRSVTGGPAEQILTQLAEHIELY